MKKLLVMLLAVAMVLTMTFALASCGGDDTTDDSSKPAEQSKVESTEGSTAASSEDDATSEETTAAPSEDVTSEESVSEDATSEDATSEESAPAESGDAPADSSAPSGPVNYVTTPTKTNYALGKTYTLTRDGTDTDPAYLYLGYSDGNLSWSDVDLEKMTDGIVGDIADKEYADSMVGKTGISVMLVGTNKLFEYVIDLGDYYGDINSIVFRQVRNAKVGGGNRGFKLRLAQISDNGTDWTKLNGNMEETPVPGAPEIKSNLDQTVVNVEHFNCTYKLTEAAKGKFVRIILVSDGGYVIQLEEIEIWN